MAKRISLREFQESLVSRLSEARRGEAQRAQLGIEAGREHWLLELSDSAEIVPVPTLTPVPLTKPWFAGVANIRGQLYSVVDFAAFQGHAPTPRGPQARLLLPHARFGINAALLVGRALGLRSSDDLDAMPDEDRRRPWSGACYTDPHGQTWRVLQMKALLTTAQFLDVAL